MNLGSGKRILSLGISLLFLLSVHGQDRKTYRYTPEGSDVTTYSVAPDGSVTINYFIPAFEISNIVNSHGTFYRVDVPGHVRSTEAGKPELPVLSRLISIPEGSSCRIRISDVKSVRIKPSSKYIEGILYPAQESESKIQQAGAREFRIDRKSYDSKGLLNSDTVTVVSLGKSRKMNVAAISIYPFRYNPASNKLEIITAMKIEVTFAGGSGAKNAGTGESVLFAAAASKGLLNYNMDLIPGFTVKPARMIILTDTAFRKQLQPFIRWKTQKGFNVTVLYKGAAFAGTTYTQLKDTICKIYNSATEENPAPEYLLIIGDVNRIPCYKPTYYNTDMYYGEFDGNGDYFPEMFTGRIPAQDTARLRYALDKIIQYEKFGFDPANNFYSKALVTTGYDPDYTVYMNGQVNYSVTNYLTTENNITESHFNHPAASGELQAREDSIKKLLNNGTSFVNYSGHGGPTGWLLNSLRFDTADLSALTNKYKYPVVVSNACQTGQFYNNNSFGNKMLLAKEKGAVGFIGCSEDSYWDEDFYYAVGAGPVSENPVYAGKGLGLFDRFFHSHNEIPGEWFMSLGQMNYSGNLAVSASTTSKKKYYWETYNVIGDPSLIPIIGTPSSFSISLPDTLPNGIRSFCMSMEPFSYVAISHFDTLWDATYAGASGSAILEIPPVEDDSCMVVITGQNRYPLIKTIYFSDSQKEFLNLGSASVNDINGNNNGKADYGEKVYLSLSLSNLGMTDAYDVSAKITSSSPWLTIESDTASIGTLARLSGTVIEDKIEIIIAKDAPDLSLAPLNVTVKSQESEKQYVIDLLLHSPRLSIQGCSIDDSESGNNDHIPDPGESFFLVFRVSNLGSSDASGQLSVNSMAPGITIYEPSVKSGILRSGEISSVPVLVELSQDLPAGNNFSVSSVLNCDPYVVSKNFSMRAGKVRETFEAGTFNVFPWIQGSIPWVISETSAFEGMIAARSGVTPDNGYSLLQIKAYYPDADTIKFWYKVSSEKDYDILSFLLNGKELFRRSGDIAWTQIAIPVPQGLHQMEWKYKKDSNKSSGADCAWIDLIDFTTGGAMNYITRDLQLIDIVTPSQQDDYGTETISAAVQNSGKELIDGFNLAYTLNDKLIGMQYFNEQLLPGGGPVTVSFNARSDMSRYGVYNIKVFGFNNDDDYHLNDTLSIRRENLTIDDSLAVFPNPFREDLTLFINSKIKDRIVITLTSVNGRIIYSNEKAIVTGENRLTLPCVDMVPGIYYLNISGTRMRKSFTVMKILK